MNTAILLILVAHWLWMGPSKQEDIRAFRAHWGLMLGSGLFFALNVLMERGLMPTFDHMAAMLLRGVGA